MKSSKNIVFDIDFSNVDHRLVHNYCMNKLPENFCIAPFVQCTTHPSRSFSPCPYLGGTVWPGAGNTIIEQWQSSGIEDLRTQFLNNKRSDICTRCWHEEDNHKKSLRLRLFDPVEETTDFSFVDAPNYTTHLQNIIESKSYLTGPEALSIKNGNLCNAKCRVCHPGDSSRWIADAKKLKLSLGKTYYSLDQAEQNWSDQQIESIVQLAANLKRLELFGGEPTFNKQVTSLLKRLVDEGLAPNIILYVNTNGEVNLVEKWPWIRHFRQVEIGVSIDGVEQQFEYIRHGVNYNTVIKNVRAWQEYFDLHQVRYSIDSITTVQILNIFYLPEIKARVQELLPLAPYWNLLVDPAYLFVKNMPDHVKQHVIKKLSADSEYDDIINVIQQPTDEKEWKKFLEITHALDQIRGENFEKTFPEFADFF